MSASGEAFDSRSFLSQLTTHPGVYRMYGAADDLLYVGKARNLKKRVGQYFLRASGDVRIESMVSQICRVEVTVTRTEDEALILENNLIKEFGPRYNVQYRDDKSYPYVRFSSHRYPRISYYRGAKTPPDRYFGPFPNAGAVRETLNTLQKLFRLRPCRDSFFANRQRPCLQHQIKRCTAPCVALIEPDDYARDLAKATRLLEGRGDELATELMSEMEQASEALDFERAARVRDQISALKRVRENRVMTGGADALDVIAVAPHASSSCVVVMSVRDGVNLGHRSHFPKHPPHTPVEELLDSFISQHYTQFPSPPEIVISHELEDIDWLDEALTQHTGRRVSIRRPQRGIKLQLMEMALNTAAQALSTRLVESASMDQRLIELQRALDLDHPPRRMECFDISHTGGEKTVASCVVFDENGPLKSGYRKFNIDTVHQMPAGAPEREGLAPIQAGDDYAAIRQAVMRRFARIKSGEIQRPDILFIDGGKGQLSAAMDALDEIGVQDLRIVAIAKGPTRKPGMEELILPELEHPLRLAADSPALHLIQRIRDEAHRFAITGHRGRREKARLVSGLESIEGLGPARRRALLKAFGGTAQLRRATLDQLAQVDGVSRTLAERIYDYYRG